MRYRRPPRLIFNGVDTDLFHPVRDGDERGGVRRQLGLPLDRPVALFVGRFVEKKGLHILHEAARRAGDLVWVFAGWGPIDPRGWDLPNVRDCHFRASPARRSRHSTARATPSVLPSIGEGFPAVMQEALASGLPVVCGAETAQADERLTGLVRPIAIENRDPAETAAEVVEAVRAAIAAPQRDQLADVADWYSWPRSGRHHLDLVRALCGESAGDRPAATAAALRPAGTDR